MIKMSFQYLIVVAFIWSVVQFNNNEAKSILRPSNIPGTELKTHVFYKIGLKPYPHGVVSWTEKSKSTYNFVQIDNNPDHLPKYKHGGEYHKDSMWEFVPVLQNGNEIGWYGLRNRGRQGAYLTWSPVDHVEQNKTYAFHIILEKNYPGSRRKSDFFLKPIQVIKEGRVYYQIIFKNLRQGVVTRTEKNYEDKGSYFLEVDSKISDKDHMKNYKEGGKWYDDTLFSFGDAENETNQEGNLEDIDS